MCVYVRVHVHGCGWMSNLWQKLQDGSGEQRANCKSDEKGERILHIACLHERNDEDSGEGEGIDHGHTQERKAPHWGWEGGVQCKDWIEVKGTALLWDNAAQLQKRSHITSR